MYADIVETASFWLSLIDIDRKLRQVVVSKGCPRCGGPLHVADYQRQPRGIPDEVYELFRMRFSTCCGHCRRRCLPPSVRFLGRRVYAGAIVILATMNAIVCGAASRTLGRWSLWWTELLPAMAFWGVLRARFASELATAMLPASMLQRFETEPTAQSQAAIVNMLRALCPLTTSELPISDGAGRAVELEFTQNLHLKLFSRVPFQKAQAPPSSTQARRL